MVLQASTAGHTAAGRALYLGFYSEVRERQCDIRDITDEKQLHNACGRSGMSISDHTGLRWRAGRFDDPLGD